MNGQIVYAIKSVGKTIEYAYNKDETIHYRKYISNTLVEEKVYDDLYFKTTEAVLTRVDEEIIDETIHHNEFTSAIALEKALYRNGVNGITVSEENGAYLITPVQGEGVVQPNARSVSYGITGLITTFPVMSNKLVGSKYFYAKPSPTMYTLITCKDTRNTYVTTSSSSFSLAAGLSVVVAAAKIYLSPSKLLAALGLASSVTKLIESINFSRSIKAKAYVLRQAWMYDRTNYLRQVSVYTEYDTDTFTVGKPSDTSQYGWNCDYQSLFDRISINETLDEGIRIWQYNMDMYGLWKGGDL